MRSRGFTLLELLIALSIASFMIFAIGKALAYATQMYQRGTQRIAIERRATMLLDRIEIDLLTATLPLFPKKEKVPPKEGEKKKQEKPKPAAKAPSDTKKKKKPKPLFHGQANEDDTFKFGGTKHQMFESLSYYGHSPLLLRGKPRYGLLEITYKMQQDKALAKAGIQSFKLYRTQQVKDRGAQKQEGGQKKKVKTPQPLRVLVADDVADFSIEYFWTEKKKEKGETELKKLEVFAWGEQKKPKKVLPDYAQVHLTLWDETHERTATFDLTVPFLTTPRAPKRKKKKPGKQSATASVSLEVGR